MKHNLIIVFIFLSVFNFCTQTLLGEKPKYLDTSLDFKTRARDLVQQMTLEEKISQLGSAAPAIPRLGISAYNWWNECLHGVARAGTATVFPQAIGLAATFDIKMMRKAADIISTEARAKHHEAQRNKDSKRPKGLSSWSPNNKRYKGLTFWSPNINIFRDPRWGRGQETYGEDPYLTGQMGIQFVKGLQGNDSKYLKVVATAKHFAVHNGPEPDRHSFNVTLNTRDLWETYLPASLTLAGEWKVEFDPKWGAPAEIKLSKLISWTDHDNKGVHYYSGAAFYTKTLDVPADWLATGRRVHLDLGDVRELAEVLVNGKSAGVLWKPPFRADITSLVKPGANALKIEVMNMWINRLVGDQDLPAEKRFTRTNMSFDGYWYRPEAWRVQPAGLLGPVRLFPSVIVIMDINRR